MWQANVGTGSGRATTNRDLLTKMVAMATSQGVATVVVNAAGSGYVTGDILTLTHAGAYLVARFEVTAAAGAVTALRILSNGAFANRATTATVSAGGTGYAVGNIIEVQGGSFREKAKFSVATLAGSAAATVTLFETGGAYSSTPSNPAATTKIGPTAGSGSGATLTVTYTGLIGTTGLATTTTGAGTGCTVDITLAQTGWAAERNTNSTTFNGLTDEKEVVLKADAAGRVNKPYVGFTTFTRTSGLNTRYIVGIHPMTAHNVAIALSAQPGLLGNPGTWSDEFPYILCDENAAQEMDFWFSMNDREMHGVVDINSSAGTSDDRQFMQWYVGMYNSFATETEDPYPMFAFGARATNIDPSPTTTNITGLGECIAPTSADNGVYYYRSEDSSWVNVINSRSVASQEQLTIMFPMANMTQIATTTADNCFFDGPVSFHTGLGSLARVSPTRRLFPVPGSVHHQFLFPLTIVSRAAAAVNQSLDSPRGNLNECFFIYNTDSAGATIANFALDYITVGTDRYRVFHCHVNKELYNYVAMRETI